MHLNFIIPYRTTANQIFRKKELDLLIVNIQDIMKINNNFSYNIYIIEQNNDDLFNRGILLNIGFIQAIKTINNKESVFIHCNTDYKLPIDILPDIFHTIPNGFIDIHGFPSATLGGFVLFDANSFIKCNGFPNDIYGWGGEDWGIWKRIIFCNINILRPKNLYNKWIIENKLHIRDNRFNNINTYRAINFNKIEDIMNNGINNCQYIISDTIINYNVFWYKVNFNYHK